MRLWLWLWQGGGQAPVWGLWQGGRAFVKTKHSTHLWCLTLCSTTCAYLSGYSLAHQRICKLLLQVFKQLQSWASWGAHALLRSMCDIKAWTTFPIHKRPYESMPYTPSYIPKVIHGGILHLTQCTHSEHPKTAAAHTYPRTFPTSSREGDVLHLVHCVPKSSVYIPLPAAFLANINDSMDYEEMLEVWPVWGVMQYG